MKNILQMTGLFVSGGHGLGATLTGALPAGAGCVQVHAPTDLDAFESEGAAKLAVDLATYGIQLDAMVGGAAEDCWNSIADMERTVGLTVGDSALRKARVEYYRRLARITSQSLGGNIINGHLGAPHRLDAAGRTELLRNLTSILAVCSEQRVRFNLETGPEDAKTLLGILAELQSPELIGVNFDMANAVLYGRQEPRPMFEALMEADVIHGIHIKDARWTTGQRGKDWGTEVPPGEGDADCEWIVMEAIRQGYDGAFIVEREIPGESPEAKIAGMTRTLASLRAWCVKAANA